MRPGGGVVFNVNWKRYDSNIIIVQVKNLLGNEQIERCGGPWGSNILLAPKPHQGHIENIDDWTCF